MARRTDDDDWPEAMATVTACQYSARAGRAIAFGLPSSKHFQITFNFWAEGELRSGSLWAEKAMPTGTLFSLQYDPADPERVEIIHAATGDEGS